MPNWTNNVLELAHEDPAMIARAQKAFDEDRLLEEFVPVPEDLKVTAGFLGDAMEQEELETKEQVNLKTYGYKNWYDYCVNEWGTKWDVASEGCPATLGEDGRLTMGFDSAWSPPLEFYAKMCDLGFSVRGYYYESGMCFAGIWEDHDDDFYDLSQCRDAQEVEDTLPTVLDEMFCISEYMCEYEEDNKEPEELSEWYKDGVEKKGLELKSE